MKHIYQVIDKAHGTRSSPLVQTSSEMVESFEKVFNEEERKDYFVLILSSIPDYQEDPSELQGISRFPLITLSRFIHMTRNPENVGA